MNEKTVVFGDAVIELRRLTYGGRLSLLKMTKKFVPSKGDADPQDDSIERNARFNFINLTSYTQSVHGVDVESPDPSDSQETFNGKFAKFLELDEELVNRWVAGVKEVSQPLGDRATLPQDAQTEEEKNNPS